MDIARNNLRNGRLLTYLGIGVLLFSFGVVFGLVILGWWFLPSGPPAPGLAFVTLTPGLPRLDQLTTPPSGAGPNVKPCAAMPADWRPYTVHAGDTLSELAAQAGISQEKVLRSNCMTSPALLAGQLLYLPPLPTPTPCPFLPPSGWGLYTIQTGDILFNLATARGITVDEVIRLNCLSSPDIVVGQQLYLPQQPTPTPCVLTPSADWGPYIVQDGDTLFSLATLRGTSVDIIMRVNCLSSPDIMIGQQLYLPLLPTATPTEPPTPTSTLAAQPTPTPLPGPNMLAPARSSFPGFIPPIVAPPVQLPESPFSLRDHLFREILPPPDPNAFFLPCLIKSAENKPGDPWISAAITYPTQKLHERGRRAYFFACDFPYDPATPLEATTLTAQMEGPDGVKLLEVRFSLPPSLPPFQPTWMRQAQGVVIWPALCNLPFGPEHPYTLVIKDGQNHRAEFTFELFKSPLEIKKQGMILAAPQAAPVGTAIQVYYCGYEPNKTISIDLFYQTARLPSTPTPTPPPQLMCPLCEPIQDKVEVLWGHADSWDIPINDEGWATQTLPSSKNDRGVAYRLADHEGALYGEDVIWLLR